MRNFRRAILEILVSHLLVLIVGSAAWAHIPTVRGHLVASTRDAEIIVVGTVRDVTAVGPRSDDVDVTIDHKLRGATPQDKLRFRSPHQLGVGDRCVLFLRHAAGAWESVTPSGTIFPAKPSDDPDYQKVIGSLVSAFALPDAARPNAVRAALLPALTASNDTLRYHAALELAALAEAGHGPNPTEKAQLQSLLSKKDFDPALQPLIQGLLREH